MKIVTLALVASAVLAGSITAATGCVPQSDDSGDEQFGDTESKIEGVPTLDGAYAKQGGTPLYFVFKKGDTKDNNTFFGEIDVDGEGQRASGKLVTGRDNLGTTMTLTPHGQAQARPIADAGDPDAAPADLQAADTRTLVEQAFSGTVHYLKIGKNETILVRGDTNGKTAQYKKVKSWCGTNSDCSPNVQTTGLACTGSDVVCTSKSTCACK